MTTMHTTNPLLQVSGASATAQRNPSADRLADGARDSGAFASTLTRELAARKPIEKAPAPTPAPKQQSKPNAADKPANREPAREPVRATVKPPANEGEAKPVKASTADAADGAEESAEAAEAAAAAATPVTDMLAFMASLTKPAAVDAAALPADAAAATVGEQQLTALENALKNMGGALAVTGDDAAAGAAAASETLGKQVSLAAGVQRAPVDAAATQGQGQAGAALPEGQHDAAQFQAQLRESQLQAAPAAAEEAPAPLAQLQAQAAKLDAAAPATVPGDRIPARVGTQAWDNQVSQRIVYMVGKEQAATLTLNPPDLGPVQIVLNVSNDQATVAFSSEQLDVRQALENALPRLREMMSESGITLGNATVDAGAANQRQQQDGERRAQGGNGGNGGLANGGADAEPAVNEVAPRTRTVSIGDRGMVDLFA